MSTKFKKVNKLFLTSFIILISFSLIFINFLDKELFAGDAITIFLDPGHGGRDPGCVHNGLMEKEVNLKIALKLKSLLESNGFKVIMRRTSDQYMSLNDIANMANNSGADLFLSIHNNASFSPASLGTETYWCANGVQGSSQFATSIQSNLVSAIGRPNRGVKSADFRVLKNTKITAALVECVFVSNPEEANLLKDDGFLDKITKGLFNGISSYAKSITPKSSASGTYKATRVLVNIDEPTNGQTISGTFELKGWAVEESGINSPEITAVHVYDGPAAGAKNIIGIATYGIVRSDVASSFGKSNFTNCGFQLLINCNALSKGTHVIHVYAHNEQLGWDYSTVKVNVVNDGSGTQVTQQTVDTPTQGSTNPVVTNNVSTSEESSTNTNYATSGTKKVLISVDNPKNGQNVSGTFELTGWAIEQSALNCSGITSVHVYDGKANGEQNILGVATYGLARPDVADSFGKGGFTNCGFNLSVDSTKLSNGTHTLYIYAYNYYLGWKYTTVKINYTGNSSSTTQNNTSTNSNTSSTDTTNSNATYSSSGKPKTIISIDAPSANQQVSGTFELAGWAIEQSAINSTGITAIHVYDGPANGAKNMIGVATYGLPREDVSSYFGKSNFKNCGFRLNIDSSKLSNGLHTLYIYAYSQNLGWKCTTIKINYTGNSSYTTQNNTSTNSNTSSTNTTNSNATYSSSGKPKTIINIDAPSANQQVSGTFELAGWAVEQSAINSTGITAIHIYNGPANGEQNMLGVAEYGIARSDVASSFGKSNFTNCGFKLNVNSSKLTNGKHTLYVYAYNPNLGWKYVTVAINYAGSTSSGSTSSAGGGTVITNSTNIVGYIDVTVDQLVRIFEIRGSSKVNWARRLAPLYIKWGKTFNIRADIAWAMMCHETGFLEFGGIAKPEWNNFCGLGVTGPDAVGCRFDSEELGIIAHYAHLAWYVYPSHINEYCSKTYDPRHSDSHYFNGNSTIGTLNARWAPSSIYTDKILLFANRIYGN